MAVILAGDSGIWSSAGKEAVNNLAASHFGHAIDQIRYCGLLPLRSQVEEVYSSENHPLTGIVLTYAMRHHKAI